jgi:glycosyltransferase involved in cell wall biosynthesis
MKNKLLLVTFPVDLGSKTFATRLINIFEDHVDLKIYSFNPQTQEYAISRFDYTKIFFKRLFASYNLNKEIFQARKEGRKILFQGITPALFAYPTSDFKNSYIVTDWTRKLYEPILNHTFSNDFQTYVHQKVINSQKSILCLTDAVLKQIQEDYHTPISQLKKAKVPFNYDLNLFYPSPLRDDNEIRILFVGGRLAYKGGDILISWFRKQSNPNLKLTIVTRDNIEAMPNVKIENNVNYGDSKHIALFKSHDIFILPTVCDAYPSVLGEAACSGLAILATKQALGAPEIIENGMNGYICNSREELINQLSELVCNQDLIKSMKTKSREIMGKKFDQELVRKEYLNYIFE